MGYIYRIINNINGKSYIGKTEKTPKIRWRRHISTYRKGKDRPLYRAFRKYGIENFSLETLEECKDGLELCNKEIYYIEKYDTFKNGYNCTTGGDGKPYLDYDLIYKTYLECGRSYKKTSEILHISRKDLSTKLENRYNEPKHFKSLINTTKPVLMFSKDNKFLKEFSSSREAVEYLQKEDPSIKSEKTIKKACRGKRKTAHGYLWKYK